MTESTEVLESNYKVLAAELDNAWALIRKLLGVSRLYDLKFSDEEKTTIKAAIDAGS